MTERERTPSLGTDEAIARLRQATHARSVNFYAMYSSVLGGIITDPTLMVLPFDDHMVHRGHAVFDTAILANGMLYQLDRHLDRFLRSAEMARISLPFARPRLRQIIIDTAAASNRRDASVRYWLSAGPGGFGLGPAECVGSSFYVMIFKGESYPDSFYTQGVKVVTSTVAIKPPFFAQVKSTNYLPNVLVVFYRRARDGRGELEHECSLCQQGSRAASSAFRRHPFGRNGTAHT
ncbi:MAG: hypothetical protein E6J89_17380 [Deltaproteobacteria bacterium]|nr:MAG: hypothetical protein E6J89_17380 [Deltaproteobacteria bacterium]